MHGWVTFSVPPGQPFADVVTGVPAHMYLSVSSVCLCLPVCVPPQIRAHICIVRLCLSCISKYVPSACPFLPHTYSQALCACTCPVCPSVSHLCAHFCPVYLTMSHMSCLCAMLCVTMHCPICMCPCLLHLYVRSCIVHMCTASWAYLPVTAPWCAISLQGIVGLSPGWCFLKQAWACLKHRTLTQGPSLQLEQAVRLETGELEAQEPKGLVRQSVELRRQLQEEQASYRRKLQAYQEGQQRQAQLVQRLQAKVRAAHTHPCPHCASLSPHSWAYTTSRTLADSAVQETML